MYPDLDVFPSRISLSLHPSLPSQIWSLTHVINGIAIYHTADEEEELGMGVYGLEVFMWMKSIVVLEW